jgi:15-cis-phytoene desaturase
MMPLDGETPRVLVIGAGLAGLSCAFELQERGIDVHLIEARQVIGGRTASWVEDGMPVESGLHKFLGVYRDLPRLMERAGIEIDKALTWVDELTIHDAEVGRASFGAAPFNRPLRTLWSALTNTHLIPTTQKAVLLRMALAAMRQCRRDPIGLDQWSVDAFARKYGVQDEVIQRVLSTSTQAIWFMPATEFSTYALFAPVLEAVKRGAVGRIGAFNGGMTQVMAQPIAQAVERLGGRVECGIQVDCLLCDEGRVVGVRTKSGTINADQVVVASALRGAQQLLGAHFCGQPWCDDLLALPTLSAVTVQFELDQALFPTDHTHFSSTSMACFGEQSHTTFTHVPGRLSAILYPPEEFFSLDPDEVVAKVYDAARKIELPLDPGTVRRYRIIRHAHDFYRMQPGTERFRPAQQTPVEGLFLAGDYTRQPFVASMEGAVLSGKLAADAVTSVVRKQT